MRMGLRRPSGSRLGAVLLAAALALTACGGGSSTTSASSGASSAGGAGGGGAGKTIKLGIIPSWTDGLSTAYLLKNQLEAKGYTIEITQLSEAAPLYAGLAKGDVDIYPSAWPEVTHAAYMKQYGSDLEDLGSYYDNAKLTMAVPDYVDVKSIADLPAKAGEFDGKVIGIEPGAGLTKVTKEGVFPAYGLGDKFTLVESSTTAMLAQLKKATDDKKPIVVTLWRPFWANNTFPVRDLEDPKGALGKAEALHFLAHKGFSAEFPEAAALIGKIKLDDAQYGSLEDAVVNKFGKGKEAEAITAWLGEHKDWPATLG